jgi:hypothetical protein
MSRTPPNGSYAMARSLLSDAFTLSEPTSEVQTVPRDPPRLAISAIGLGRQANDIAPQADVEVAVFCAH